jgi:glycosyltransferase involved in cell wall biosynthesis
VCNVLVLDSRDDAFSESLEAAGIGVRFAKQNGANVYAPNRIADICDEIEKTKPDVVHAHLAPSFHWCALASIRYRNVAYLVTEHASDNRRMHLPFVRGFERLCYKRYDRVAAVSRESADSIRIWLGLEDERFVVIPNGIPLDRFTKPATPAADVVQFLGGRIGIAMTARLVPPKDHPTALRALAKLPPEFCLVLTGEGPERTTIENLAGKLGVKNRCLLLGARLDIPMVLAACSVYLQTSIVEGFGIAALEAMAAGVPTVASDARGLGKLVRNAGLLFPVGDSDSCARALERVFIEPGIRDMLISSGRERAAQYSIHRCADAYASLYGELTEVKI